MKNSTADKSAKSDFEALFNKALQFRDAEKYDEALAILRHLSRVRPDSAPVFGILGDVYWRTDDLHDAVESFRKATGLSPKSELASLGLFHTLREAGKLDEAEAEMRRFLAIAHSDEYAEIVKSARSTEAGGRNASKPSGTRRRAAGRNTRKDIKAVKAVAGRLAAKKKVSEPKASVK